MPDWIADGLTSEIISAIAGLIAGGLITLTITTSIGNRSKVKTDSSVTKMSQRAGRNSTQNMSGKDLRVEE